MIVLHTVLAIGLVVGLIIALKVEPVIALVAGCLYLGFAGGLRAEQVLTTIADGFGEIMVEVGLLIGFGVLIGALLFAMGALQRLVALLLRLLGPKRLPYALSATLTTLFPSIYVDVQLVLASPIARSAAPHLGRRGLGVMGGAVTAGILVGYVFVIPGLGTVSIAGLLDVPLGTMLLYGLAVGPLTALAATGIFALLCRTGLWNPDTDVDDDAAPFAEEADVEVGNLPPLTLALLPIVVPLLMIAGGAVAETADISSSVLAFVGDPVLALFVGLVLAYVLARTTIGTTQTDKAVQSGLDTTGQILLITGVGGSLGAVIGKTSLESRLTQLFTADEGMSVLVIITLCWLVAAVLHLAIGSISVAAIAASGIVAPVLGQLDVNPAVIGLAIGSGALFALHVNSNFFWMFQSLMGVTTQGTLKALTLVTSLASLVSLPMVMAVGLVT